MDENLEAKNSTNVDNKVLTQVKQEENTVEEEHTNCTTTKHETTTGQEMFNDDDDDDSALLVNMPEEEIKVIKLDETKLLIDNNDNSLSVDTLIEILSNDSKIPISMESESVIDSENNVPQIITTPSSLSTLNSPASTSSTSHKNGNSSETITSPGPSPKSTPKKYPSPYYSNGGKPMISDMNKKMKSVANKKPPRTVYQSQISDNTSGIKLCIKKSVKSFKSSPSSNSNNSSKTGRKRSRKPKSKATKEHESDSDDAYVKRRKRTNVNNNNNNNNAKQMFEEPVEQSGWGKMLPKEILFDIFKMVIKDEGAIPTACRLARVCSLWREVSLDTKLWQTIDLSTYFKEKNRTEVRLKWFIENRMLDTEDLNISHWKITNTLCVLEKLVEICPNLKSISLAGWRVLSIDDLSYIADNFPHIARIDLSSINTEMNTGKTAVGLQSLVTAIEKFSERLTHLNLAHNRLSGIPQITAALTAFCPNLIMLDLSNVKTVAVSHGMLHVEKLQEGCQKLKILRIANSHVQLSNATLQEQMSSPGFPDLEELSVASLANESRLMSDEALQRILKASTKLKLLDVRGCARLTHDSLIRIPAWDLKHLFLSGCSVTRDLGSGLELIASKWAHSLIELDLAWATMQVPLDNALRALADRRDESPLNHLNLCGSAVSVEAVKEILNHCQALNSINLASCRGLPRGIKRLLQGSTELAELRENLKNEN